jgi:hypothetical protein
MSWDCPERKKRGKAQILEAQKQDVEEKGVEDERSLMMKKVLLKEEPDTEKRAQRNNLFRTSCKMKDKFCKVIIDSRSTDKLVSMEMVEKLDLETITNPTPYKVSLLQKGHHVTVTKQCLDEFKIGGYNDEILCDMILMDVCHVLLGTPWEYDMIRGGILTP